MDFPASIARALAIPANDETGSIHDVKHVVVMMQDRSFDIFREDVLADRLPQVSWIVGAWYVSQMLDALTANPEVWSKTVFFYIHENDGFFDHMVPPTPP
jgi:phospholipase C